MNPRKCSPAKYFSQNFRPIFEAPGMWDRAAAKDAIVKARELMIELAPLEKKVREMQKRLRKLKAHAMKAIENADPQRSP